METKFTTSCFQDMVWDMHEGNKHPLGWMDLIYYRAFMIKKYENTISTSIKVHYKHKSGTNARKAALPLSWYPKEKAKGPYITLFNPERCQSSQLSYQDVCPFDITLYIQLL